MGSASTICQLACRISSARKFSSCRSWTSATIYRMKFLKRVLLPVQIIERLDIDWNKSVQCLKVINIKILIHNKLLLWVLHCVVGQVNVMFVRALWRHLVGSFPVHSTRDLVLWDDSNLPTNILPLYSNSCPQVIACVTAAFERSCRNQSKWLSWFVSQA